MKNKLTTAKPLTKRELLAKLKLLGLKDKKQVVSIVCSLIGHSKIQTYCFGYFSCARCDAQVGDALGGVYNTTDSVIVGHKCPKCEENFKKCTWRDKYLAPNPFK